MHYNRYNNVIIIEQQKKGLQLLYFTNDVYILCKPKLLYDAGLIFLLLHLQNEGIEVCKLAILGAHKGMLWSTLSTWR